MSLELSSSFPRAGSPGSAGCDKTDAHSGNVTHPKLGTSKGICCGNVEGTTEALVAAFRAAAHWEGDKTQLQRQNPGADP